MDVTAYLDRIGHQGSIDVDAKTLRDLQVAHLLTVPFENLAIHADEPIVLEEDALFDKVVRWRRGGFCYELNGLFAALLSQLGFDVSKLSARVATDDGGFTPDFDHMTLVVRLDERWLVDVGFGDTFRDPLRLDTSEVQTQHGRGYRLQTDSENGWRTLMARKHGEGWKPQYRFTLQAFELEDFVPRCRFHQTSPDSHFRRGRVCSRATSDGRLSLSETRFIATTLQGERDERTLSGEDQVAEVLSEHFGIAM